MKTYLLYHGNCPDGFGSAYAAYKALGEDNVEYIPVKYGDELPSIENDSIVYICDFTFPRETLISLNQRVKKLVVLDHHKTAKQDLEGLDFAIFDMDRSGVGITWDYFHKTPLPYFLQMVQDCDLWKFELEDTKFAMSALRLYEFSFSSWDYLVENTDELIKKGKVALELKNRTVNMICDNAYIAQLGDYEIPMVNATCHWSDVGDELGRRYPDALFTACYFDIDTFTRKWSLRTRKDFDVSEVAKKYGGGGHKKAAGFLQKKV